MIAHKTDAELPALWHGGVDWLAVKVRFEVVKRQIGHGLAGLAGGTSDVGAKTTWGISRKPSGTLGSFSNTSKPAPAITPFCKAWIKAS